MQDSVGGLVEQHETDKMHDLEDQTMAGPIENQTLKEREE